MRLNVNIPIRLAVDLDTLEHRPGDLDEALAAATGRALRRSAGETSRAGDPSGVVVHDPTFAWRGAALRTVTPDARHDTEGRLARVIQRSARSGGSPAGGPASPSRQLRNRPWRGWRIQTAINFHTTVGEYTTYFGDFVEGANSDYYTLYEAFADELRWVSLWVVQVDRTYRRDDLGAELAARARELNRVNTAREDGIWVEAFVEAARQRLIQIDHDHLVEGATSDLSGNGRYTAVYNGERYVLAGAQVVFTMMKLPIITLETYARLDSPFDLPVAYRDLDFLINQEGFQSYMNVSWQAFIAAMGDQTASLHVTPVEVTARVPGMTLAQLTEGRDLPQLPGPNARRIRSFRILNQETMDALPSAVRSAVALHTNAATLSQPSDARWGPWQVGWRGAEFSAPFELTADQQFAINNRARATQVADGFIDLLGRYPADSLEQIVWWGDLNRLIQAHLGIASENGVRTMFDLVMADLQAREAGRWFNALLDRIASSRGDASMHFLQAAMVSRDYGGHPRIAQIRADYNQHTRDVLEIAYFPGVAMWLHKDPDQRVPLRGVVADAWSDYVSRAKVQVLNESKRAEFDAALDVAAHQILDEVVTGRSSQEYTQEQFANAAINRASLAVHLSNDDFEKATQLTSLRITAIEATNDQGIEAYRITFNLVQKLEDDVTWTDLPDTTRSLMAWDFEFLLSGWQLGRMGERFETVGLVISGIAIIAVAWEAGIIAALVEAAGGTAAVLTSIAISEILYLATAKHYSIEGFVMAAIDGYIMALTFRGGGIAGRAIALRIGRATMPQIVGGWIAERLTVGIVGGALGGGAVVFAHGLAEVLLHQGHFPSLGDYARGMEMGALFGLVGEFVIGPALQGAFRVGGRTVLNTIGDAARVIRESGVSPAAYASDVAQALGALRARLATMLEETSVREIIEGLRDRMASIGENIEGLPGAVASGARRRFQFAMLRRILELSDIGLGRVETDGLERLLSTTEAGAARMSQEEMIAFLNRLRLDAGRAQQFLNALGRLTDERVSGVVAGGQLDALATAPNLLTRLSAGDLEQAWAVLTGPSFRMSAADFEAFLGRIAGHPEPQQTSALEILRRPEQLVTPEGVVQALGKAGLGEGIAPGLDRLYGALESAAADNVMRSVSAGDTGRFLRGLGTLRQEVVNNLARDGYVEPLASAPRVLERMGASLDQMRALTAAHGPFGATLGDAVAGLETFLGAIERFPADQQQAALDLLQRPGNRVPPRTVRAVLEAGIPLDNEVQRGLDHVHRADSGVTFEQLQAATGGDLESVLRGLSRNDLPNWSRLGHVEAILRNDGVRTLLSQRANLEPFRTFLARYPGNEGAVIDALGRLLNRVRQLGGGSLRSFETTELMTALNSRAAQRGGLPIAEIDQIAGELGQSSFPTRTVPVAGRPTIVPAAAEEARAFVRLLGDNVVPVQAHEMLSLPTDVTVARVEVAGEGAIGPDVLFTTSTGESIGREAVATAIPTVDPANPLAALDRNLSGASLEHKITAYSPSGVVGRRPGLTWLRKEIDVRIDPSVDGFSYDALLQQMQADGSLQPFLDRVIRGIPGNGDISRIRFYNSQGTLVLTWTP